MSFARRQRRLARERATLLGHDPRFVYGCGAALEVKSDWVYCMKCKRAIKLQRAPFEQWDKRDREALAELAKAPCPHPQPLSDPWPRRRSNCGMHWFWSAGFWEGGDKNDERCSYCGTLKSEMSIAEQYRREDREAAGGSET